MARKIRLGLLFGGKSAEHEVSLLSTKRVLKAIDKDKYDVVLIGIDKNGEWHLRDEAQFLLNADSLRKIALSDSRESVALVPLEKDEKLVSLRGKSADSRVDVIFPILHGPLGEDGTIQGLLKLADIPFVGAGVLGSALGMDKDVMKRLLREAGIPIAKFATFHKNNLDYDTVAKEFGVPFFLKPANLGSSIGISKVKKREDFQPALDRAFGYDRKILIEEFIEGKEIECAVLGDDQPMASLVGEVIPRDEFYSYQSKYEKDGVVMEIPARISASLSQQIQDLAIKTYQTLCCEGMARVDFFLKENGQVYVNEINTLPGLTQTSFFPIVWEASNVPFSQVVDRLVECAIERFVKEKNLNTNRDVYDKA